MAGKDIDCKVVKVYGIISETTSTEKILAEVSWNGRAAKLEVRNRNKEDGRLLKGIAISKEEIQMLYSLIADESFLTGMDMRDSEKIHINLEDYLTDVAEIKELRKTHATKDGYILLHRINVVEPLSNGEYDIIPIDQFNEMRS